MFFQPLQTDRLEPALKLFDHQILIRLFYIDIISSPVALRNIALVHIYPDPVSLRRVPDLRDSAVRLFRLLKNKKIDRLLP